MNIQVSRHKYYRMEEVGFMRSKPQKDEMKEFKPNIDHKQHDENKDTRITVEAEPNVRDHETAEQKEEMVVKQKTKRVATLDAFRGLTVVVSLLYYTLYNYIQLHKLFVLSFIV